MKNHIALTATELGYLWNTYQSYTLSICVLRYFNLIVEDTEIKPIIDFALQQTEQSVKQVSQFFQQEEFPVPLGFTDKDVDPHSTKLYTDPFILHILWFMARTTLSMNAAAINTVARRDVFKFYEQSIAGSVQLLDKSMQALLSKGLWIRAPYIPVPDRIEFIQKQSFMQGLLGKHRSLTGVEIGELFYNSLTNSIGLGVITGFAQVTKDEKLREYFLRGRDIANKHIEVFTSILRDDTLPAPAPWNMGVTSSKHPPFSDKLMLTLITNLNAQSISGYSRAAASSMRNDLTVNFTRLATEIAKYSEDGFNLLIANGWMEQPPKAAELPEA